MAYIHGYTEREFERLRDQSGILEALLHSGTSYPPGCQVLETGCGVGAQTRILAKRNPKARITAIDISQSSILKAEALIKKANMTHVSFKQAGILDMPFPAGFFDHVFVCFVLEHLADPPAALNEIKRVLKPGGTVTVIEGDHGSCFWHPETEASLKVWHALIQTQQELGHDPLMGRRLYPLLDKAGFEIRYVSPRWLYADGSDTRLLDGMVNKIIVPMVKSSQTEILKSGMLKQNVWDSGIRDLEKSGSPFEGTFFYTWFKGVGVRT